MASLSPAEEVNFSFMIVAGASGADDDEFESLMWDTQTHQPQWEPEPADCEAQGGYK